MVNPSDWNREDCTSWCGDGEHNGDPACWADQAPVVLTLEEGFPREVALPVDPVWLFKTQDPPRVGVYAYREQPGYREVVYLHLYRPSDTEHRNLDCSVHLTGKEALQLAHHLLATAAVVDPTLAGAEVDGAK